jgi:predicted AlkP superfamily phosphohydrolase/phosphomutase
MAARDGSRRTALIGLDGATTRVLDPLVRAGVMPVLARLRQGGFEATLRSTIPAYTPPGWVSMATGVNPGRHGVFGFMDSTPQEPPKIAHSGSIRANTVWSYLSNLDVRVGILNVPMSYPPVSVNGFLVAGGLATGWTDPEMPNFASDPEIGRFALEAAGGRYPLDTVVNYENDWRSPETVTRLEDVQRLRRRVLGALVERTDPEFVFAVFEGPDRLQHVFYQCIVECSDWYDRALSREVRERAYAYFAELDQAIGDLHAWAGADGNVVIVSDHGSGPWEKTVNVNLLLAEWRYAELPSLARLTRMRHVAGLGQRMARRILPRSLLHRAKASIERGIVWESTRAFASHVAEQGIHVNVRGTLPRGIVEPSDVASIEDDIVERFLELRDPDDGETVTDHVYRRADVIHGPYEDRAPNLFPMLRGQRYELSDTLAASAPFTDHRDRPWGYHHLDGVFIAEGPSIRSGSRGPGLDIVDVLPTVLHLSGYPVPDGLDGRVATEVMEDELAARNIDTAPAAEGRPESSEYPFSAEDEEAITESLRGLGYIE